MRFEGYTRMVMVFPQYSSQKFDNTVSNNDLDLRKLQDLLKPPWNTLKWMDLTRNNLDLVILAQISSGKHPTIKNNSHLVRSIQFTKRKNRHEKPLSNQCPLGIPCTMVKEHLFFWIGKESSECIIFVTKIFSNHGRKLTEMEKWFLNCPEHKAWTNLYVLR